MKDIQFEWDAVKAESNLKKHKVSFHEGFLHFAYFLCSIDFVIKREVEYGLRQL